MKINLKNENKKSKNSSSFSLFDEKEKIIDIRKYNDIKKVILEFDNLLKKKYVEINNLINESYKIEYDLINYRANIKELQIIYKQIFGDWSNKTLKDKIIIESKNSKYLTNNKETYIEKYCYINYNDIKEAILNFENELEKKYKEINKREYNLKNYINYFRKLQIKFKEIFGDFEK